MLDERLLHDGRRVSKWSRDGADVRKGRREKAERGRDGREGRGAGRGGGGRGEGVGRGEREGGGGGGVRRNGFNNEFHTLLIQTFAHGL